MADETETTETASEVPAIVETTEGAEQQETAETEGEAEAEQGDLQEERPRSKKNVQARIDELTRRAREAERSAEYYRGLATQSAQESPSSASNEPDPADFEDYGEYVRALAKHTVSQERQASNSHQAESFRAEAWSSKVEATRSTLADYDKVVGSSEIPIAGHVADALMDAERGPELAYHLALHPDVADRLNKMSQNKALMEMGRIELSLGAPAARPASRAPAPITPTRPGPTVKTDLAKSSMDDYVAARKQQGARWAR